MNKEEQVINELAYGRDHRLYDIYGRDIGTKNKVLLQSNVRGEKLAINKASVMADETYETWVEEVFERRKTKSYSVLPDGLVFGLTRKQQMERKRHVHKIRGKDGKFV